MKLVFYSLSLNHHQAPVADAFYKQLGKDFCFVELATIADKKGSKTDYSGRPYLLKAWHSDIERELAMTYAKKAEVCIFSGVESLPFEIERLNRNLLSFDMGERILKRGLLNLASPRILRMVSAYFRYKWSKKPLYKLCCSSFASNDLNLLGMFKDKCFKWGYFTAVEENDFETIRTQKKTASIMWCGRFVTWKHPEFAIELANMLKRKGYDFTMDIFGGEYGASKYERLFSESKLKKMISSYNLNGVVNLRGKIPNYRVVDEMRNHDIFLFTSDKREGWGAVANESMANGCVLVASDKIGSSGYLIDHGVSGLRFKNCSISSLTKETVKVLDDEENMIAIQKAAFNTMRELWNPHVAASRLLTLIKAINEGRNTPFISGPCSKA